MDAQAQDLALLTSAASWPARWLTLAELIAELDARGWWAQQGLADLSTVGKSAFLLSAFALRDPAGLPIWANLGSRYKHAALLTPEDCQALRQRPRSAHHLFEGTMSVPRARPRGVFVVDDEAGVRTMLVLTLRSLGANVWDAGDGPAALAIFTQHASEIDLAMIDLNLPGGMNGEDVAAALRQMDATLPCCLITGDMTAPLPSGFCCALAKPFMSGELATLLASCTRGP